jgi:hypothetical protein
MPRSRERMPRLHRIGLGQRVQVRLPGTVQTSWSGQGPWSVAGEPSCFADLTDAEAQDKILTSRSLTCMSGWSETACRSRLVPRML